MDLSHISKFDGSYFNIWKYGMYRKLRNFGSIINLFRIGKISIRSHSYNVWYLGFEVQASFGRRLLTSFCQFQNRGTLV